MPDELQAIQEETARALAKRWGLLRPDGTIKCSNGMCERTAKLPELKCEFCLDWKRRGH